MKKLVLTALCAMAFAACGDDGGGSGDVTLTPDGGAGADAAGLACNPVTQAGCEAGQKCAQLVSSDEPFLASTACVPDGSVTAGGMCTRGEAGANGYDDCVAGYDCLRGVCTEICTSAGGDTCRTADEAFGEGAYCTLYADLFSDEIGLCIPGCDPTDDTTDSVAKTVTNAKCGADNGCYLNIGRGVAACAGTPADAVTVKQNQDCYGPAAGSCYLNGCASGFSPILPDAVGQASTTNTCARYCTPVDTYIGAIDGREGMNAKCGLTAMSDNGSGALGGALHQCHFIQSLYGEPLNPASQGMCVPISPWYDCTKYDFTQIQTDVLAAADMAAANTAFNNFCYGDPMPPDTAEILEKCDGISFGCTSLATRQPIIDKLNGTMASEQQAMSPVETREWLKARLKKNIPTQASAN